MDNKLFPVALLLYTVERFLVCTLLKIEFQTKIIPHGLCRCSLPKVKLLNFEAAPVLDLRVTQTNENCTVEMLSCKVSVSPLDNIVQVKNTKGVGKGLLWLHHFFLFSVFIQKNSFKLKKKKNTLLWSCFQMKGMGYIIISKRETKILYFQQRNYFLYHLATTNPCFHLPHQQHHIHATTVAATICHHYHQYILTLDTSNFPITPPPP
jgi:hypothetical protein